MCLDTLFAASRCTNHITLCTLCTQQTATMESRHTQWSEQHKMYLHLHMFHRWKTPKKPYKDTKLSSIQNSVAEATNRFTNQSINQPIGSNSMQLPFINAVTFIETIAATDALQLFQLLLQLICFFLRPANCKKSISELILNAFCTMKPTIYVNI